MDWKYTTVLLCIYGIIKEFRPATPFLTPYLISGYKNLTLNEVYGQIFPYWTYSYMVFLIPVFVLTDVLRYKPMILRYKPMIVVEGACLSITWALLVWGEGVWQMQLMQVAFGKPIPVFNYIQSLWLEMQPDPDKVENGLVEFVSTLIDGSSGAILAFFVQFAAISWVRYETVALVIPSVFIAIILAVISQTQQVLIAYIGYVCITSTYHLFITVASTNIACQLTTETYGLVFGWNTFVAVVLQTALTLIVVDSHGLNLDIRTQIPIFILTDMLRYKPIIVLEGACLSITWAIIVWGEGVRQMQLMQMFFGVASASKVAYYSYMYAVVDKKHYRKVTSYARSAALVGKLLGFGLAQTLISTGIGSYLLLNEISLIAVCIVFFIAIALPAVPSRGVLNQVLHEPMDDLTFEGRQEETGNEKLGKDQRTRLVGVLKSFSIFKDNICNYTQSLWIEMQPDHSKVENGLIEFLVTLIGLFLPLFIVVVWDKPTDFEKENEIRKNSDFSNL
ncbi:unnamed protein product [Haemonchus placei]|uniref:Thiamine transporter 2 n=1 Tax=Haemonchus placei TaxID=6290 RepID=A0A0N4W991_HAEPC|nr:unnamed protein product [Haemonchus placei]